MSLFPPPGTLSPLEAFEALGRLASDGGEPAFRLAMHAAIPQTLRVELLHLVKLNFVPEAFDDPAVESDVLLSEICEDLGAGYYQFDSEARRQLVNNLATTYAGESTARIRGVAGFVLRWVEETQKDTGLQFDRLFREFLEIQRWVALSYLDPREAAHQFAEALADATGEDAVAARLRIGGLASAVSIPLAHEPTLLSYARGLEALQAGETEYGTRLLSGLGEEAIRAGDVTLRSPREVLGERAATAAGQAPAAEETEAEGPPAEARETPRIVISYRREDSSSEADRLYDRLIAAFDREHVFMEVAAIESGQDFAEALEEAVSRCDALVALVGPDWATATDQSGRRRLDDPHDFVRLEISTALKRRIRVIPVLVGGARMPHEDELPEDLKSFSGLQALELSHLRFEADAERLIRTLKEGAAESAATESTQPVETGPESQEAELGPLFGVPELPEDLVPRRAHVEAVLQRVLDTEALIIIGEPGTGKTALAAQVARDPRLRRAYRGGVRWIRGADLDAEREPERLESDHATLLVIDDVGDEWTSLGARVQVGPERRPLLEHRPLLVTMRDADGTLSTDELHWLYSPDLDEPLAILAEGAHVPLGAIPPPGAEVARLLREDEAALRRAAARFAELGHDWETLLEDVRSREDAGSATEGGSGRASVHVLYHPDVHEFARRLETALRELGDRDVRVDSWMDWREDAGDGLLAEYTRENLLQHDPKDEREATELAEGLRSLEPPIELTLHAGELKGPYLTLDAHAGRMTVYLVEDRGSVVWAVTAGGEAAGRGDFDRAERWFRFALEDRRAAGGSDDDGTSLVARAQLGLGRVLLRTGRLDEAEKTLQLALDLWEKTSDHGGVADCLGELAELEIRRGSLENASGAARHAIDVAREAGDRGRIAVGLLRLARIRQAEGAYEEVFEDASDAVAIFEELQDHRGQAAALRFKSEAEHAIGRHEEAMKTVEHAVRIAEQTGDMALVASSLLARGTSYLRVEDFAEARRSLEHALDLAHKLDDPPLRIDCLLRLARVTAESSPEEGLKFADEALELSEKLNLPESVAAAEAWRGLIARELGDTPRAVTSLARCIIAARRLPPSDLLASDRFPHGRAIEALQELQSRLGEEFWHRLSQAFSPDEVRKVRELLSQGPSVA